ncbi:MAG: hypothetical protein Q4C96_04090 [Planctomycetia bacterium]|nr:hypothetical protein [Planctomycetia bacterium]
MLKIWMTVLFYFILFFCFLVPTESTCAQEIVDELTKNAAEIEKFLSEEPFSVIPPITDREYWEQMAEAPGFRNLISQAEKAIQIPIPVVEDALYLQFSQNGNRTNYQKANNTRNRPLMMIVYAECFENKGRFIPRIEEYIHTFAQDKSWVLPAHDRHLVNFNGEYSTIDLASSKLSWDLATIGAVMGDKLSPEVRRILNEQLEKRCFSPFRSVVKTGKPIHWWLTGTNNWNAVCLAGVTGAALANLESKEERAWFIAAALHFIKNSDKGYTEDGYCSEGVGYWNYGFGHYLFLSEIIRRATDGKFQILDSQKLRNVALYGVKIEILPGICPSFSDCSTKAVPDGEIMYLLNRYYGFQLPEWENYRIKFSARIPITEMGIWTGMQTDAKNDQPAYKHDVRSYFPEAGILVCRPKNWTQTILPRENVKEIRKKVKNLDSLAVAMKGGHNAEHHNHNDVGTYVVVCHGEMQLMDLGAEVYTRRTFSKERYESKILNSWGHAVPLIGGQMQKTGNRYRATILETSFTDAEDVLKLDLSPAYDVDFCKKLTRTFRYKRNVQEYFNPMHYKVPLLRHFCFAENTSAFRAAENGNLNENQYIVEDSAEFTSAQTFETPLITTQKWLQCGNILEIGSLIVKIEVIADGKPTEDWKIVEGHFTEDFSLRDSARRLAITLNSPVKKVTVKCTITPGMKK